MPSTIAGLSWVRVCVSKRPKPGPTMAPRMMYSTPVTMPRRSEIHSLATCVTMYATLTTPSKMRIAWKVSVDRPAPAAHALPGSSTQQTSASRRVHAMGCRVGIDSLLERREAVVNRASRGGVVVGTDDCARIVRRGK